MLQPQAALKDRNSALYCDFVGAQFVSPSETVTLEATTAVIGIAERQLAIANEIFGTNEEDAARRIREHATQDRYDAITNTKDFLSALFDDDESDRKGASS